MEKCDCNFEYCKKPRQGGGYVLKQQCFKCGKPVSQSFKYSDVGGKEKVALLKDYDEELENSFYSLQRERNRQEYLEKRKEALNEYNVYLQSDIWRNKRKRVLERDNYVCKACEKNVATQVHHLTYEFIYDEPLFTLVSVCVKCHDKIEKRKRENKGIED